MFNLYLKYQTVLRNLCVDLIQVYWGLNKSAMWAMVMTASYVTVLVRWLCTSVMVNGQ